LIEGSIPTRFSCTLPLGRSVGPFKTHALCPGPAAKVPDAMRALKRTHACPIYTSADSAIASRVYGSPSNGFWLAPFPLKPAPRSRRCLEKSTAALRSGRADAQTESYIHCPPFMASASTKRLHVQSPKKTTPPLLRSNNKRSPSSCRAAT